TRPKPSPNGCCRANTRCWWLRLRCWPPAARAWAPAASNSTAGRCTPRCSPAPTTTCTRSPAMRKFLFAALLALPLLAAAATPPKPFEADYEVRRNDEVIGVGHIRLRALPEGGFEMSTRSEGTAGLAAMAGV